MRAMPLIGLYALALACTSSRPVADHEPDYWAPQELVCEDRVYSPTIHAVQFFKKGFELAPPVIDSIFAFDDAPEAHRADPVDPRDAGGQRAATRRAKTRALGNRGTAEWTGIAHESSGADQLMLVKIIGYCAPEGKPRMSIAMSVGRGWVGDGSYSDMLISTFSIFGRKRER